MYIKQQLGRATTLLIVLAAGAVSSTVKEASTTAYASPRAGRAVSLHRAFYLVHQLLNCADDESDVSSGAARQVAFCRLLPADLFRIVLC